jgi:Cu/Ag efflux pump CusA
LAGVAAETGVVMLIYLDHAYTETVRQRREEGQPIFGPDLHASIIEGAVERVRPGMFGSIGCGRSHRTSALPKAHRDDRS